jgi:membrane protease YdiL (CAAX protease family)
MNPPEMNPLPPEGRFENEGSATAQAPALPLENFPEDLRVPWNWGDLAYFLLVALVASLAVGWSLLFAFRLFGVNPLQLGGSNGEKAVFLLVNQAALDAVLMLYLFAHIRYQLGAPFWRTLGWRAFPTIGVPRPAFYSLCLVGGSALALMVTVTSNLIGKHAKLPIEALFTERRSTMLFLLMSVLLAPLVEETLFRGYLYPVLARTFRVPGGIVITGVLFGLLHAAQLWGGWGQITLLMVVGILFTWARAASRTVFVSFLLHLGYNGFLFVAFLIGTAGFHRLPH